MSVIALAKNQLRVKYLKLRKDLSRDFIEKSSQLVAQKVLSLEEVAGAKIVSAYLAINNEVETKEIIGSLISRGKSFFLPKYVRYTSEVKSGRRQENTSEVSNISGYFFAEFVSWRKLERGPFGILQPSDIQDNKPGLENFYKPGLKESHLENTPGVSLDIAIIPGVAFDKKGVRLGYGKGVFDRLLSGSKALKIGLAFELQIADQIPHNKNDLRMDLVVTEKRVILC